MLVVNDLHIGARRAAGTTPASAAALRQCIVDAFSNLTSSRLSKEVVVNGDLFDSYDIPHNDLLGAYAACAAFLLQDEGHRLHLLPGNHCLSKSSTDLSSFELMGRFLVGRFGAQVSYHDRGGWIDESNGVYAIPHLVNQALFDQALQEVPAETKFLLLHCNAMSPFAEHSDHSLNLGREQALELIRRGATIILGHEHHRRDLMGGKLIVVGNQFPTSIADCVTPEGRASTGKDCLVIDGGEVKRVPTWTPADTYGFHPVDVQSLMADGCAAYSDLLGFVRVTGEVEAEQAADALRAISRLRQTCNAFVVGNSIKVRHGGEEIEDILDGVEDVRKVDVVSMLMEALTEEQREAVRALLALQT